ncbi:MAG: formyltetrahydrofolate deformylase [Oceanicoccus sp.]|jgi:formyltetrahydrofolate deformylase
MTDNNEFILKATCPAATGILAGVTGFLTERGCYISELNHFDDVETGRLFMRCRFHVDGGDTSIESLQKGFPEVAKKLSMNWQIISAAAPMRTLIMVSQYDHCLDDLLYRLRKGEINMDITAVVSNHQILRPMVEREGIRFIHLPMNKDNKAQQEAALLDIIAETNTELTILARYMQILSDNLCTKLSGKVINIHHSFLPSFKGAKPYHQAFERGVKLIGATAHYVTADLDEGPIIQQAVQEVDHTYSADKLVAAGRDTETKALGTAVKLHTEHRSFFNGNKTIVFK